MTAPVKDLLNFPHHRVFEINFKIKRQNKKKLLKLHLINFSTNINNKGHFVVIWMWSLFLFIFCQNLFINTMSKECHYYSSRCNSKCVCVMVVVGSFHFPSQHASIILRETKRKRGKVKIKRIIQKEKWHNDFDSILCVCCLKSEYLLIYA